MVEFYRYDADGFYVEPVLAMECPKSCTPELPPNLANRPKWTGAAWVDSGVAPPVLPLPPPPEPDDMTKAIEILLGVRA